MFIMKEGHFKMKEMVSSSTRLNNFKCMYEIHTKTSKWMKKINITNGRKVKVTIIVVSFSTPLSFIDKANCKDTEDFDNSINQYISTNINNNINQY